MPMLEKLILKLLRGPLIMKEIAKKGKKQLHSEIQAEFMNRQEKRVDKWKWVFQDIERNHNFSLYQEILCRCSEYPTEVALCYQGSEVTYFELIQHVDEFSNSLAQMGIEKGTEIPVCMTLCPEFIYLILAASKLGAVVNIFGDWFAPDYINKIVQRNNHGYLFLTDDHLLPLKYAIDNAVSSLIIFSLNDSLPRKHGIPYNPYYDEQKVFLQNKTNQEMNWSVPVLNQQEFLAEGKTMVASVADVALDDPYTITYTSGTTDPSHPKAVTHAIRSYMFLSRFKDRDVSHMGNMEHLRVLAHFPTYVHAGLTTSIFDPLFEKATILLSPIYSEKYFARQITELQPNYACGSVGAWRALCLYIEDHKIDLPFLMLAIVTGEGMSLGEEKYFNRIARRHRFGVKKLPFPLSPISFSIGGGTSESSGVFTTLFKALEQKKPEYWFSQKEVGLTPLNFVLSDVIRSDNSTCKIGEVGTIAISSPCNMLGYTYNKELNNSIRYCDKAGREWMKMGAMGYRTDDYPHIVIVGRPDSYLMVSSDKKIWFYQIEKKLYASLPTCMSCEIIMTEKGEIIFHVEQAPDESLDNTIFEDKFKRVVSHILPLQENVYLRMHSSEEPFPIAESGKRDHQVLVAEGTSCAIRIM